MLQLTFLFFPSQTVLHNATLTMPTPIAGSVRAPTLQGTFSHTPTATLSRIAAETGVSASALATISVQQSSLQLYAAVIEYAALCKSTEENTQTPLYVDGYSRRRDDSSDDDDDFSSELHKIFQIGSIAGRRSAIRRFIRRRNAISSGGKGLLETKPLIPKFKFNIGETVVVWPPPPHLTAEHLAAERQRARRLRRQAIAKAESTGARVSDAHVSSALQNQETAVAADVPEEVVVQESSTSESRDKIYISHFSVGEPKRCGPWLYTYRELLLISPNGQDVLRKFTTDVMKWHVDKDFRDGNGTKFALHRFKTNRQCGIWESEGMKHSRPPSSVILSEGQMEAILDDVHKFLRPKTKKWYIKHGLPHRRSYLFYGHPGTGKTSTIRAIASKFKLNCCYLNLTSDDFSNQVLADALSQVPGNALIVIEDVDALFNEERKNEEARSLTFSGLLNLLDGLISAEGIITVMTTNHIERLDKALIRGGRVDRRFLFDKPTQEQIEDVFRSFYPGATENTVREFSNAVVTRPEGDEARSIATLQQLFIDQRENTAEECVKAVGSFFEAHFPDGTVGRKASFYS